MFLNNCLKVVGAAFFSEQKLFKLFKNLSLSVVTLAL